jgi:hypothetical protein
VETGFGDRHRHPAVRGASDHWQALIFSGFDWDYGGTIVGWHGGKLAPAIDEAVFARVQLRMPQGDMGGKAYPQGDSRLSPDDPRWEDPGITVGGFSVGFPGEDDL